MVPSSFMSRSSGSNSLSDIVVTVVVIVDSRGTVMGAGHEGGS
jgi:hypothetical protein